MDRALIELLARRAGLDKALKEFPEDVTAAAMQAGVVIRSLNPVDFIEFDEDHATVVTNRDTVG